MQTACRGGARSDFRGNAGFVAIVRVSWASRLLSRYGAMLTRPIRVLTEPIAVLTGPIAVLTELIEVLSRPGLRLAWSIPRLARWIAVLTAHSISREDSELPLTG